MHFPVLNVSQCTLLAILLGPIALSFRPDSIWRKILLPVQACILINAFVAPLPAHRSQADLYNVGLVLGTWAAKIVDRIYIHKPEDTFLRKGVDDRPSQGPQTYGPWRKFLWAGELIISGRGVGWNWQVAGAKSSHNVGKKTFILDRLQRMMITFFLIDMVARVSESILADNGISLWGTHLSHSLFLHFFITAGWLTVIYGHITLPENLCAILMVALGSGGRWSDPSQWPPMFGSISEAYTLRRFWGKFWHAALRRSTNAPGLWIMERFPSTKRPTTRAGILTKRYGFLFLAFGVSGLIHASGSYIVTRNRKSGISDGGALVYFFAQPIAIVVEDLVHHVLGIHDNGQPSILRRVVGYVYVSAFWLWCFPNLKVVPLAHAHGIYDSRGPMLGAVRACGELARAMPFNPAQTIIDNYLTHL
ncbi:hypothetical protein QM012_000754 [Aureobasidium pullulans]|uniref:Wax synthase domain-containing protein n=1 Tax=Aureobasidium pullulans TaxID=5580 RepID=A0ABR0TWI8_AURPU